MNKAENTFEVKKKKDIYLVNLKSGENVNIK